MNHVRPVVQKQERRRVGEERGEQARLRSAYLSQAMDAQQEVLRQRWSALDQRVYRGDDAARLARDEAKRRLEELGLGTRSIPESVLSDDVEGPDVGAQGGVRAERGIVQRAVKNLRHA